MATIRTKGWFAAAAVASAMFVLLQADVRAQGPPEEHSLSLDVGNDTNYDWTAPSTFIGPERLEVTEEVNHYVRGGCWCLGCRYDTASGNCTVPAVFTSKRPGNLTVDDAELWYTKSVILGESYYGKPLRRSEGGCWEIEDQNRVVILVPIPPEYNGGVCLPPYYSYTYDEHGSITPDDAVDDAVYRLLNETLDTDRDGRIDVTYDEETMSFQAEGRIGVQSLWGPVRLRLVVWS